MPLPPPATTSPGKLRLVYENFGTPHEIGANFIHDVDITDLVPIQAEAVALAEVLQTCCIETVIISGFRIADPAGVTLYEEAFDSPLVGSFVVPALSHASDSATVALTGKGSPALGLLAGQTRLSMFVGYLTTNLWGEPTQPVAAVANWADVRDFMVASTLIGADFYGSKATWRARVTTQINAHFQRRLGL